MRRTARPHNFHPSATPVSPSSTKRGTSPEDWKRIKNAFWFAWHKYASKVTVSYTPLSELRRTDERFDVVLAGAILEHLSDPVTAIGAFGRVAKEAVIIACTPLLPTEELIMRPITSLENPAKHLTILPGTSPLPSISLRADPVSYITWWALSRGLYRRIFANIGFEAEFVPATAYNVALNCDATDRWTIIARRAENVTLDEKNRELMEQKEADAKLAESTLQQLKSRLLQAEAATKAAEAHIAALHASTSWRITKPLRVVSQWVRDSVWSRSSA